jgi:uncharacterized membrane protein
MEHHRSAEKDYNLERLIFLSDGLFAIVITLLVLELKPPENWDRTIAGLLHSQWRPLAAYVVTFISIGLFWNAHRAMFARVTRFHPGLVVFNLMLLGLLGLLGLLPYAAELIFEGGPRGDPYLIYVGLIAAISLSQAILWGFATFIAKVIDVTLPIGMRAILFGLMIVPPCLLTYFAIASTSGRPLNEWGWIGPVMAIVALARRRLLRRAEKASAA